MARTTVYLPEELLERARAADLNISGLLRRAIISKLRDHRPGDGPDRPESEIESP